MNLLNLRDSRELKRFFFLMLLGALTACSSASKRTTPRLSEMEGMRVALVEIDAEPSTRLSVEVSLVNELISRGSFILVNKADLEKAKQDPALAPGDHFALGQKLGTDYILKARVLNFSAEESSGYVNVRIEDSQLAAEQGDGARWTEKPVKAKSLIGTVQIELEFTDIRKSNSHTNDSVRTGLAVATERVDATEAKGAIHLPSRLSFLDKLTKKAIREFFNQYRD